MEPRIAELLVRGGIVTREQLTQAQEKERDNGSSTIKELVRLGFTSEETLTDFLAKHFGIERVEINPAEIEDAIFALVPPQLVQKHQLIPLKLLGSALTVAMADPTDLVAINEIKFITGYGVRVVLASPSAIKKALERRFGGVSYDEVLKKFGDGEMEVIHEADDVNLQELQQATMEAPVVTLVNAILADAARRRASDIHIEPYEKIFRVRFRVDGVLQEIMGPPLRLRNPLVSRLKVMAGLDIAERRLTQDGRIKLKMGMAGELDVRVSVLPTLFGEKVVMRLLDKTALQLDMSKLGFDPKTLEDFHEAIHKPYGMILITGPTGSGKSTTLYSALSELNKADVNISTAEDPVEYNLVGINQVQVREQIGLTFAACLRSFLRQDPDIIMVGEIRDLETAQIAVKAALTGHLVLSTLHTNDAPSTVDRLINMGVEPFLLTSSINIIAAQRLVRRICDNCKEPVEVTADALINLGVDPAEVGAGFATYHGRGCANCNGTGYRGRLAIYEVMVLHEALKEMILRAASAAELKREAVKLGMSTLRMSALQKVRDGLTTIEETARVTDTDKGFGSVFSMGF
ncbi:MAG: type IV-A pilus assembly ATPase PilB [Deltaproteobacteria bacterium]|nr:type IV-A pilus assembly ATPase PilB [Deltaproteobacteria bacterium]MBI2230067.1 type IV-A pilus assembly ATPase PilB [Deltaproteobacteria bacterium]MBI2363458.1 type IV-A pilus assembly ATPase PilB [Deltaproteobacteria bacterium]MBI2532558.1 type IV-A pilus assembly ATPase PilB [Deltaproteobacteria bacterium]